MTTASKRMNEPVRKIRTSRWPGVRRRRREAWRVELPSSFVLGVSCFFLISCATAPLHEFAQPAGGWQTRTGQLLYRNATTTLIGEATVRYSNAGDFELTFSKGPGVTLLILRQDKSFAEVRGALVRGGWSGPIEHAPARMRGWLSLRNKIVQAQNQRSIRVMANGERFEFRF